MKTPSLNWHETKHNKPKQHKTEQAGHQPSGCPSHFNNKKSAQKASEPTHPNLGLSFKAKTSTDRNPNSTGNHQHIPKPSQTFDTLKSANIYFVSKGGITHRHSQMLPFSMTDHRHRHHNISFPSTSLCFQGAPQPAQNTSRPIYLSLYHWSSKQNMSLLQHQILV